MLCYVSYVAETKRKKKRILLGVLLDWRYTRTGNVTEIHADWKLGSAADKFLADPDQTRGDPPLRSCAWATGRFCVRLHMHSAQIR
jgi:hypothetical protein